MEGRAGEEDARELEEEHIGKKHVEREPYPYEERREAQRVQERIQEFVMHAILARPARAADDHAETAIVIEDEEREAVYIEDRDDGNFPDEKRGDGEDRQRHDDDDRGIDDRRQKLFQYRSPPHR